jgi:single-strand DNA-binding protein
MSIDCAFSGFLAADPDCRTSKAGKPWARIRCGIGSGDAIEWASVACFGSAAETAAGLKKGDKVYVEGTIKLDHWTASDGAERYGLSVATFKLIETHQIGRNKKREFAERNGPRPSPERSAPELPDDPIPF